MHRRHLLLGSSAALLAGPARAQQSCFDNFDHCLTIGARSNLILQSADLTQAAWSQLSCTIAANATAAPDGTTTAGRIIEAAATATHGVTQQVTKVSAAALTYTWSVYAKQATRTVVRLLMEGSASGFASCLFDLSSGTPAAPTLNGAWAAAVVSQIPAANGFYRCTLTALSNADAGIFCDAYTTLAGASSYAGDGTSGLYVWGGQLERGSIATPYIPTAAAAAIRTN